MCFDRLLERLEQDDMARPEVVPLWASLLSLPATDRFPPLSLSPARQREATFRALIEWLQNCAARLPISVRRRRLALGSTPRLWNSWGS